MAVKKTTPRTFRLRAFEFNWATSYSPTHSRVQYPISDIYRAAPAFIINAEGRKSRQIDIAIYDHFNGSPLFPHPSGLHIPIESVCAVFEVKPTISKQWLRDAGAKAASVRALRLPYRPEFPAKRQGLNTREDNKVLSGLLAASSVWSPNTYANNLRRALNLPQVISTKFTSHIDLGCSLQHGAFLNAPISRPEQITISTPGESLAFLIFHLLEHLRILSVKPTPNLLPYRRKLNNA